MSEYLLGFDIGSSSVKASLIDIDAGVPVAGAKAPDREMPIVAPREGWAEQDPEMWWRELIRASRKIVRMMGTERLPVKAIGLCYQEHGLVAVDRRGEVLRPAIIWCDSRAIDIGNRALCDIGRDVCFSRYLNSPGNFTASRLAWVKQNEPGIYSRIQKIMLPGDYIAMKLTGDIRTTTPGLSEGILFDFSIQGIANSLLSYFGIASALIPEIVPTFGDQGRVTADASKALGIEPGAVVAFRAGDQHANAFGLGVLDPGEAAANAGTSGVVYAVCDKPVFDSESRVNTFVHVNHLPDRCRYGVVLCINGAGILYSWLRKTLSENELDPISYSTLNASSETIPIGSEGLTILPYGNGAERTLKNRNIGASIHGLDFNVHGKGHLLRAAQEGIAFAMGYGFEVLREIGIDVRRIRTGKGNLFQSSVLCETISSITGCSLEILDTDGAQGAARGAGIGIGRYRDEREALGSLTTEKIICPDAGRAAPILAAYERWKETLAEAVPP